MDDWSMEMEEREEGEKKEKTRAFFFFVFDDRENLVAPKREGREERERQRSQQTTVYHSYTHRTDYETQFPLGQERASREKKENTKIQKYQWVGDLQQEAIIAAIHRVESGIPADGVYFPYSPCLDDVTINTEYNGRTE